MSSPSSTSAVAAPRRPGPWTDAHCHLADSRLAPDLDAVVERARAAGVVRWVQGGVGPDDWKRQRRLRERLGDAVRTSVGLHPWWVADATDDELDAALAELEQVVTEADGLGEVGLDKHPRRRGDAAGWQRQQRAFVAQLELVRAVPRPLVLHVVRAHGPVLDQLARWAPFPRGGLVHAFAGTAAEARRYIELGFHLSLGGGLAARPDRAVRLAEIPLDRVVVETDAPDQAPRDWGVVLNEPAFLPRIAEALAAVWGISGAELLDRAHVALDTLFGP